MDTSPACPAPAPASAAQPSGEHARRVLIVDDEQSIRHFSRLALEAEGLACDEAANGLLGVEAFHARHYDLVLCDMDMPEMNGAEVCRRLRQDPRDPHLKILMFSGRADPDELSQLLLDGADDYLLKPFTPFQLQARVHVALRLKAAQERADRLNRSLMVVNRELEKQITVRDSSLVEARNALFLALAKLAERRDTDTGRHLNRIQVFAKRLAEEVRSSPAFADQVDDIFVAMLTDCAPLHDIGKVGLPDAVLCKPGKLEPHERVIMQQHTVYGAETLSGVAEQHSFAAGFLRMAIDIARHHHERFDGRGYPDGLAGTEIPLSARIVTICDVYDALRSPRVYKPAFSHTTAMKMMSEGCSGQFDPALFALFLRCAGDFENIYQQIGAD